MKFYSCKVCGIDCLGLQSDGETYVKEVCSDACLQKLQPGGVLCGHCFKEFTCPRPLGDRTECADFVDGKVSPIFGTA